jgi:thioester reductase-like protein
LQRILSLSLSCPKLSNFTFCSSTASILNCVTNPIPETISHDPEDADLLGYSKSKWVAESICNRFASQARQKEIKMNVIRVGQLTGDTTNGVWNMNEAWPLLLSTVKDIKCLPHLEQRLDWLPLDIAAKAVIEIGLANKSRGNKEADVYNLLNVKGHTRWVDLLRWVQEARDENFDIARLKTWAERLKILKEHPAQKLTWLWKKGYNDDGYRKKEIFFSTRGADDMSEAIRTFEGIDRVLINKIWEWLEAEMSKK